MKPLEASRSWFFHPALMFLSSYEDGTVGGDSPKLIRLPGEPENAGKLFAQSVVFCSFAVSAAEVMASSNGDITGFPLDS